MLHLGSIWDAAACIGITAASFARAALPTQQDFQAHWSLVPSQYFNMQDWCDVTLQTVATTNNIAEVVDSVKNWLE
jgi:hypothetical protein